MNDIKSSIKPLSGDLKSIAFIRQSLGNALQNELCYQTLSSIMTAQGIEVRPYDHIDQVIEDNYEPDCVVQHNLCHPKIHDLPTIVLLDIHPSELLETERYQRNLLTFDGFIYSGALDKDIIRGINFGARRIGVQHLYAPFHIAQDETLSLTKEKGTYNLFTGSNVPWGMRKLRKKLLQKGLIKHCDYENYLANKTPCNPLNNNLLKAYYEGELYFHPSAVDEKRGYLSWDLLNAINSGCLIALYKTEYAYSIFQDNVCYLSADDNPDKQSKRLDEIACWAKENPKEIQSKIHQAQKCIEEHFGTINFVAAFKELFTNILKHQGYLPDTQLDTSSVSYIMRTGGDPKYIDRALDSLVAQQYPNLTVLLVLYKPLPRANELIKKYKDHLKIKIVEGYSLRRAHAIIMGFQAVETDYFAMMDDDDTIHRNHLRTLLRTIKYHDNKDLRGKIKLAYSGSYVQSYDRTYIEAHYWQDFKLDFTPRHRVVEHHRFYHPDTMAKHHWYMSCHTWLASKDLLDDELYHDPGTHTGEDLYFELQFAARTHFAFSSELSAVHWFHGSNSTELDSHRHHEDFFRHAMHLMFRTYPSGKFYRSPFQSYPHRPSTTKIPDSFLSETKLQKLIRHMSYGRNTLKQIGLRKTIKLIRQKCWLEYNRMIKGYFET